MEIVSIVAAAGIDAAGLVMAADDPITDSAIFNIIQTFFRGIGVIVVLGTIWSVVKGAIKEGGASTGVLKKAFGGFAFSAILFDLTIPIRLSQGMGNVVSGLGDVVSRITGS